MQHIISDLSVAGHLCLMVPTNHLNGALKMELEYSFAACGDNKVPNVKVTPWLQKQDGESTSVILAPTDIILGGMKRALDYFAYAVNHIKWNKTDPRSFTEWFNTVSSD